MSLELVTYAGDRRLLIGAAEAIRQPIYTTSWSRIRIALQCSFDGVASSITASPALVVGVCSGSTNVLVEATATNLFGFRFRPTTWTYAAGPPSYFNLGTGVGNTAYRKVGSTETTATMNVQRYLSNDTGIRSPLIIEIAKGSPNYTIQHCVPLTVAGAQADFTDVQFQQVMEIAAMTDVDDYLGTTNYTNSSTSAALAADEVAGSFDHIFVYWERTSHKFTFNLRHKLVS